MCSGLVNIINVKINNQFKSFGEGGGDPVHGMYLSVVRHLFSKMFKYEKPVYLRHKETLVSFLSSFFIELFMISLCSGELAACTVHSEK